MEFFIVIYYVLYGLLVIGMEACNIIGKWKCFEKAGEPGWKALIPFYNWVVYYKISGMSPYWLIVNIAYYLITICGSIIYLTSLLVNGVDGDLSVESFLIATLTYAVIVCAAAGGYLALNIVSSIKFAKAFGKGGGYAVGLIFIPYVFLLILGFGNATYVGPHQGNNKQEVIY